MSWGSIQGYPWVQDLHPDLSREMTVPKAFFEGNSNSITFKWIDLLTFREPQNFFRLELS